MTHDDAPCKIAGDCYMIVASNHGSRRYVGRTYKKRGRGSGKRRARPVPLGLESDGFRREGHAGRETGLYPAIPDARRGIEGIAAALHNWSAWEPSGAHSAASPQASDYAAWSGS